MMNEENPMITECNERFTSEVTDTGLYFYEYDNRIPNDLVEMWHIIKKLEKELKEKENLIHLLELEKRLQDNDDAPFRYDLFKVSDLDSKLDFIVNLLFTIRCHVDVHYNELLGSELAIAELLDFNVNKSKTWDYDKESYNFKKSDATALKDYFGK